MDIRIWRSIVRVVLWVLGVNRRGGIIFRREGEEMEVEVNVFCENYL